MAQVLLRVAALTDMIAQKESVASTTCKVVAVKVHTAVPVYATYLKRLVF
jgi:hypothetical protein